MIFLQNSRRTYGIYIDFFCGGVSPGIEPIITNAYTHKKSSGSFLIKKPKLVVCLEEKGMNTSDI